MHCPLSVLTSTGPFALSVQPVSQSLCFWWCVACGFACSNLWIRQHCVIYDACEQVGWANGLFLIRPLNRPCNVHQFSFTEAHQNLSLSHFGALVSQRYKMPLSCLHRGNPPEISIRLMCVHYWSARRPCIFHDPPVHYTP